LHPTSSFRYRLEDARLRDLPALQRLEKATFPPHEAYDVLTLAYLLLWPGAVNIKVVESTGELVGYVAGTSHRLRGSAWIVTLAVHPGHRRRGLGRRLLVACEARLRQPVLRLTVRRSNAAAIALYESAGYHPVRVRRHYYADGEDGIVMEKRGRP
jgi:ribosomal-protein-alanine N-acetyltransferase